MKDTKFAICLDVPLNILFNKPMVYVILLVCCSCDTHVHILARVHVLAHFYVLTSFYVSIQGSR